MRDWELSNDESGNHGFKKNMMMRIRMKRMLIMVSSHMVNTSILYFEVFRNLASKTHCTSKGNTSIGACFIKAD